MVYRSEPETRTNSPWARPISTKVDDAGHRLGNPFLRETTISRKTTRKIAKVRVVAALLIGALAWRLSSASQLGRVDLGAASLDEVLRLLVERIAASDQYLSAGQHGHGSGEA